MAVFILIHGAFRGGWSWTRVRPLLERYGHQVWTPSLTGAGDRAHLADRPIGLATWTDDIADLLRYHDLDDVILVGHSQGGVVAAAVTEYAARRIRRVVFLDAAVPPPGRSVADTVPADLRSRLGPAARPGAWLTPVPLTAGDGLDFATAAWASARLVPSPARPAYDPLRLTEPEALEIPRTYVFCTRTPASYPSTFTRLRLEAEGTPYEMIDTGHEAPLSAPRAVADLLDDIAAR